MNSMHLECFFAAMETLNFTTAAQNVHITQPAFSRNIASFEDELGFTLFWRSKQNGLRVTPAGIALYNGLKEIRADYRKLLDKTRCISRGDEGRLVISTLNGCCMDSTTFECINRFKDKYPNIDITLKCCTFADMLASVERGESDICFTVVDAIENMNSLICEVVYDVESFLAVPRKMGFDSGKTYKMGDLRDACFILSEDSPHINELFKASCRMAGFEPKTRMAPDYETKMLWVEAGIGVAANSSEHYLKDSAYVDFIKVEELHNLDYAMVWMKDNFNPAIALFYSMFDDVVG